MEILVAIVIGGMFIIGASAALLMVVRQNFENRGNQTASSLAYSMINQAEQTAQSDWHTIYNLSKGSSNTYFMVPSATSSVPVLGKEGALFNDVSAGLIGHWGMDESSGNVYYDTSGNVAEGGVEGSPTRVASDSCIVGACASFNGTTDDIAVSNTGALPTGAAARTFSFWMRPNALQTKTAVGYGTSATDQLWDILLVNNGIIGLHHYGNSVTDQFPNTTYTVGEWQYVVFTYDGTSVRSYINGVYKDTYTVSLNTTDSGSLKIASGIYSNYHYFNGYLDDVRVYNRALSKDEITALYNSDAYEKYFYVDNVQRDSSGLGSIVSSGGTDDPSTQKLTSVASWEGGRNVTYQTYITRDRDYVFVQNDWSGGPGEYGPVTTATTTFATSTYISASSTLLLSTTTSPGNLDSVAYDTQLTDGAALNSITWQGSLPVGGTVQF